MSKHKTKRYEEGGEIDAMEEANKGESLDIQAGPKPMPRRPVTRTPVTRTPATPTRKTSDYSNEGRTKAAPQPIDVTKMSVSDRMKASRAKSREGSTDTRSVGERFRSTFGMAKGGSVSSRADGIAQRGKTRGKMC